MALLLSTLSFIQSGHLHHLLEAWMEYPLLCGDVQSLCRFDQLRRQDRYSPLRHVQGYVSCLYLFWSLLVVFQVLWERLMTLLEDLYWGIIKAKIFGIEELYFFLHSAITIVEVVAHLFKLCFYRFLLFLHNSIFLLTPIHVCFHGYSILVFLRPFLTFPFLILRSSLSLLSLLSLFPFLFLLPSCKTSQ